MGQTEHCSHTSTTPVSLFIAWLETNLLHFLSLLYKIHYMAIVICYDLHMTTALASNGTRFMCHSYRLLRQTSHSQLIS